MRGLAWGLALAQLDGREAERVDALSGGMKRRLNVAAGVMLLLFRPFKVGAYVEVGGKAGTTATGEAASGDADQLPSVGPGNVLRDLVAAADVAPTARPEELDVDAWIRLTRTLGPIDPGRRPPGEGPA